jgi:hypothetical protein
VETHWSEAKSNAMMEILPIMMDVHLLAKHKYAVLVVIAMAGSFHLSMDLVQHFVVTESYKENKNAIRTIMGVTLIVCL